MIDFVLSNLANAGPEDRRADPVQVALARPAHHQDVADVDAARQLRRPRCRRSSASGPRWFAGSADAIYQSFNLINDERPDYVIVFGADHIYRMDPKQMVDDHIASGAGVTVAGIRQPLSMADQFGVIEVGADGRADPGVPGEAHRRDGPGRRAGRDLRVDGQLRLHHRPPGRGRDPGRRDPTASTTWAATSSRCWSSAARPTSTTSATTRCPAAPTATAATGATSGRSTRSTTRTWT